MTEAALGTGMRRGQPAASCAAGKKCRLPLRYPIDSRGILRYDERRIAVRRASAGEEGFV